MPSSKQRLEVWRGTRAKTSGGLKKSDLVKNKRGKIVSKKKSVQAGTQNNLGDHLRQKGKKISKDEMLHKKKGSPPKAAPKKPAAAKNPEPKPTKKVVAKKPPRKRKAKINPLTGQSSDADRAKVSVDNIVRGKRTRRAPQRFGY